MFGRASTTFQRHPILREVLLWSLPAMLVAGVLRWLLLSYIPYGYWGSDSKSYYSFTHQLLSTGDISLDEKRRYLYPLLMLPASLLPGAPLKWVAWLQHGIGVLTVLPLAYAVRRTMQFWRWWIVPVTMLYAVHPMFLWYEHELLGESLFFAALAWMLGGWIAWVSQEDPAKARRLFWWFLVPMAVFLLTKPSGRFVLPGVVLGLMFVRAWRVLERRHWITFWAVVALALTVGSRKQGSWLLYVASFSLTQLDTPEHAEYKALIRDRVEPLQADLNVHYLDSRAAFDFLESPAQEGAPPLWAALEKDTKKKSSLYMSLATEGIMARPVDYFYLVCQRIVASANISQFKESRFTSESYPKRLEDLYAGAQRELAKGGRSSLPRAFGLPPDGPLPPFDEFAKRISPARDTWAERTVLAVANAYQAVSDVVVMPEFEDDAPASAKSFQRTRVTPLGWYLLFSLAASLVWFRTLGVWVLICVGYLFGVFAVALVHTRFFLPVWLFFIIALFVPLELICRAIAQRRKGAGA